MRRVSKAFTFAACLWTLGVSAETVSGQVTNGTILGTVSDETRGALAGATIVIQNNDTGTRRELVTDSSGRYRAPGLPLGSYEVQAELSGFQGQRQDGIELTVGSEVVINFSLSLAQLEETVTVQGSAPQVDLTSSTMVHLVDSAKIQDLPLNGRDYAELILLQPGVVLSRASVGSANTGRGVKISVAGARPNQNLFTLDGTDFNDALNNTPASAQGLMTGVETIREFQVLTNTFSAEYGRATGGVFNVVTKSGTNGFHGSAFEFYRGDSLDSKNFFDDEKPEFSRHQFGFSLGGPIVRDRTFFFASYEGLRETKGITAVATVPDLLARQGILPDGPVDIDPNILPFLELYPLPTGGPILDDGEPTGVAEFKGIFDRESNQDFVMFRVDHTFSQNDSMFVRYLFDDSDVDRPVGLPEWPNIVLVRKHILTVEQQHLFSNAALNEFRFGFNRTDPQETLNPVDRREDIAFVPGEMFGQVQVTGLTEVGTDRTNPKMFFQDLFQITNNVSWWKNPHALKMGVNFRRFHNNGNSESRTRGRLRFRGLEEFLTGDTREFELAKPGSDFMRRYRQNMIGVFIQDDWSVSDRLVLNLGLRYEFASIPTELDGKVSNLRDIDDPEVTVGDPYFNNPTKTNFAPRAGFSWDVKGNGRTALRGGIGVFHEPPLFFQWRNPIFRTLPFVDRARVRGPDLPIDINEVATSGASRTEAFEFDPDSSRFLQYNINVQQELAQDLVVTAGYVGSRGDNLFGQGDLNIAIPEIRPDGTEFFPKGSERRNENFDSVRTILQGFRSRYNAMHLGVNKRYRDGFQFQASYTLGKVMDNRSGSGGRQESSNGQARIFDPNDFDKDYSRADFDVRHNFVFNVTYELPFGEGRLAEGWIVSAIGTLATGVPFSPLVEGDPDRDESDDNAARPNVVEGVSTVPDGGRTADQWFNPAAFSFPEPGTRGNAGRNSLDGPGLRVFDLSFMKTTNLGGDMRLQIRVEIFNLFNRANFALPANDPDGSIVMDDEGEPLADVGKIFRTSTDAREMQIGVRFSF